MKKTLKLLVAGTAATTALGMTAHGQSSDALIDKLVDKGILTVKEANELRQEADQDFTTAFQTKTGMPDWVKNYKLSGDFRGRYDGEFANEMAPVQYNSAFGSTPQQNFYDRDRMRYRLRIGLTVVMQDDMEVGFRLGSGDSFLAGSGNPLSNTSTFGGDASKKPVWIDAAYGRWTPVHTGNWNLMLTIGKMDQPFKASGMVFDPDYTPEGASAQATYQVNEKHSIKFIGGAFVLDYATTNGSAPYYIGDQVVWDASWTPKVDSSLGLALFAIGNKSDLGAVNTDVAYSNVGNTRNLSQPGIPNGSSGDLVYNYTPIVASGSITYKLDSFPFYNGIFPLTVAGEFMHNPGAPRNNEGWWAGVTLGKSGTRKTWDISYRYEFLEADAWYDQLVDDDNVAFYPAQIPGSGPGGVAPAYPYNYNDNEFTPGNTKGGIAGGTNVKGHMMKFNYSFTDSLTFSLTAYLNSLIIPVNSTYSSAAVHVMGDMQWKF